MKTQNTCILNIFNVRGNVSWTWECGIFFNSFATQHKILLLIIKCRYFFWQNVRTKCMQMTTDSWWGILISDKKHFSIKYHFIQMISESFVFAFLSFLSSFLSINAFFCREKVKNVIQNFKQESKIWKSSNNNICWNLLAFLPFGGFWKVYDIWRENAI